MRKVAMDFARTNWETPADFFARQNARFRFTLDAAASNYNAKCPAYYHQAQDALVRPWMGRVWCNPPYGRGISAWTEKAVREVRRGNAELVVMLLPANTDTRWAHDLFPHCEELILVRGRLHFTMQGEEMGAPNFGSMLAVVTPAGGPPKLGFVSARAPGFAAECRAVLEEGAA